MQGYQPTALENQLRRLLLVAMAALLVIWFFSAFFIIQIELSSRYVVIGSGGVFLVPFLILGNLQDETAGLLEFMYAPSLYQPQDVDLNPTNGDLIIPFWFLFLMMLPLHIFLVLRQRRWARRGGDGCCLHCGYQLRGVASAVCPECGNKTAQTAHRASAVIEE